MVLRGFYPSPGPYPAVHVPPQLLPQDIPALSAPRLFLGRKPHASL